jgi:hypothetical protein
MMEYELPWKLTDHQAEALQRETIAIMELLLARKSHTSNKTIRLIAMVECLAIFIAAFASREDDDQKMEELLDDLTDNIKISVRHIKAAHSAKELIERLQAKRKK